MLRLALIRAGRQAAIEMTIAVPPPGLQPAEYEAIEAALSSSARGRAFLVEYARRVRQDDAARLLHAIERLEARLEAQKALAPVEAYSLAERLEELAWSLRERGAEDFACGKIEALAREFRAAAAHAAPPAATLPAPVDAPIPEPAPVEETAPTPAAPPAALTPPAPIAADAPMIDTAPAPEPGEDPRVGALSWLDHLPLVDRFALFA
jgi:hypothetical protein